MILTVSCDACGKVLKAEDAWGEHDDVHYCELDWTKIQLRAALDAHDRKLKWLEETHVKALHAQSEHIDALKLKIALLEENHVEQ